MKTAKKEGGAFEPSVQHEKYRSGARICIEFFIRSRASNDEVRSFVRSFLHRGMRMTPSLSLKSSDGGGAMTYGSAPRSSDDDDDTVDDRQQPLLATFAWSARALRDRSVGSLGVKWVLVACAAIAVVCFGAVTTTRDALGFRSDSEHAEAPFWRGHAETGRLQPEAPSGGEKGVTRTFTMYDHCMSTEMKEYGYDKDFWISPRESAKVVRHNYKSPQFFEYDDPGALTLERSEISDGLYAWRGTSTGYDWEYGFALKAKDGSLLYEIGKGSDNFPLAFTNCSQRYGNYFNRNIQLESDKSSISWVFGSCKTECDPGYHDTSYNSKPLTDVINADGTPLGLGEQRDARLVIPMTVMMYSSDKTELTGLNPHLRVGLKEDTTFPATKERKRWIASGVDYYRKYLKMVKVEIYIQSNTAWIKIIAETRHTFGTGKGYAYDTNTNADWRIGCTGGCRYTGCGKVYCDPTRYDTPTLFNDPDNTPMSGINLRQLQYKSLVVGDSAPTSVSITEQIDGLPSGSEHLLGWNAVGPQLLFGPGRWGPDLDVRRVLVKAGAICSRSTNMGNCMYGIAQPFNPGGASGWPSRDHSLGTYYGPTKDRKQWVLAALVGYGWKIMRIEIYQQGGALYAIAIDSCNDHSMLASDYDEVTGDGILQDLSERFRTVYSGTSAWSGGLAPYEGWDDDTRKNLNLGSLYFDLAGDMRPSLLGYGDVFSQMETANEESADSEDSTAPAPPAPPDTYGV